MFLTPDAEPFVGGTYFPARDGDRDGVDRLSDARQEGPGSLWSKTPDRIRERRQDGRQVHEGRDGEAPRRADRAAR